MIHHGDTEATEGCRPGDEFISGEVIGAAVEVHRWLGPGLLESCYQACLAQELTCRGFRCERQKELPLYYKGVSLRSNLRIDLLVEQRVIIEIKAVESLHAVHRAQLLSYLRLTSLRTGLLINFNVQTLVHGVRRVLNGY